MGEGVREVSRHRSVQCSSDLDRGRTSNDRTHVFVVSGLWKIDYVKGGRSLKKALLNDWLLSAIVTVQSGQPLTGTAGQDRNLDGVNNDRADIVGDPSLDSGRPRGELIEEWFETTAFAQSALGADGTAGRNIIEGPGNHNVDLGLFRDFHLGGRLKLQLRGEATNVLNTVNLENPGVNLNAPATFGKIRAAREMRRIQLGARLSF